MMIPMTTKTMTMMTMMMETMMQINDVQMKPISAATLYLYTDLILIHIINSAQTNEMSSISHTSNFVKAIMNPVSFSSR